MDVAGPMDQVGLRARGQHDVFNGRGFHRRGNPSGNAGIPGANQGEGFPAKSVGDPVGVRAPDQVLVREIVEVHIHTHITSGLGPDTTAKRRNEPDVNVGNMLTLERQIGREALLDPLVIRADENRGIAIDAEVHIELWCRGMRLHRESRPDPQSPPPTEYFPEEQGSTCRRKYQAEQPGPAGSFPGQLIKSQDTPSIFDIMLSIRPHRSWSTHMLTHHCTTEDSFCIVRRFLAHSLLCLLTLFGLCKTSVAQSISIHPRGIDDTAWTAQPFTMAESDTDEDGNARFYAVLELDGHVLDITDFSTWSVSSNGFFTWNSGQKTLGVAPGTTATVRVSFGGVEGVTTVSWIEDAIITPALRGTGASSLSDGPVDYIQLRSGIFDLLDKLHAVGIPVNKWRTTAYSTEFRDDRDAVKDKHGESVIMTSPDVPGELGTRGRFFHKGIYNYKSEDDTTYRTEFPVDVIVLRPDIAEKIASPPATDPLLPANPNSTHIPDWGTVPLHELLHAIIMNEDLDDDFPASKTKDKIKQEELLIQRFQDIIIPRMVSILRTLELPQLNNGDRQTLHWGVYFIKKNINELRDLYGADLVNALLDALGWTDSDGDGLPDWLEQKLRDKGIDPDQPIWTPPGGGGGPVPNVDDPPPSDGEPTVEPSEPEVEPVDTNG